MEPNFFIVGAPKAGTTSLYRYLGQHPGIFLSPIKEPTFFAPDLAELKFALGTSEVDPESLCRYLQGPMDPGFAAVISEWAQYLQLFRNVRHETAVGEGSANYLASHAAPAAIHARIPQARILLLLRDPVDRLHSQYAEAIARGDAQGGFLAWVEQQQSLEARRHPRLGAVWNGFYAQHLGRFLRYFPAEQVRCYWYEQLCSAPGLLVKDVCSFLGVDPSRRIDVSRRHNVTMQPRSRLLIKATAPLAPLVRRVMPQPVVAALRTLRTRRPPRMTRAERIAALSIYQDDIRELQVLLGRDLSAWLTA